MVSMKDVAQVSRKKKFENVEDIRHNGELEDINLSEFADAVAEGVAEMLKSKTGEDCEVKVVGVGIHVVIKNPHGDDMAVSEGVKWSKKAGKIDDYQSLGDAMGVDRPSRSVHAEHDHSSCKGGCKSEDDDDGHMYQATEPKAKKKYEGGMFG